MSSTGGVVHGVLWPPSWELLHPDGLTDQITPLNPWGMGESGVYANFFLEKKKQLRRGLNILVMI